jgi:hypothetical protein
MMCGDNRDFVEGIFCTCGSRNVCKVRSEGFTNPNVYCCLDCFRMWSVEQEY